MSIEMCVRLEENNLQNNTCVDQMKCFSEAKKKVGIVKTENLMDKEDFNKNSPNQSKNKWHEKRMYGQFVREIPEEIDKDLSWKWLLQSDLKVQTEGQIKDIKDKP